MFKRGGRPGNIAKHIKTANNIGKTASNIGRTVSKAAKAADTVSGLFGAGAFTPPPPQVNRYSRNNNVNSALKLANGVSKSLFSHNHSRSNNFSSAMGNAVGGAIGSAILMAVGNKIDEKHQDYLDKKEAERQAELEARAAAMRAEQEAREAELRAKQEQAFHAMNRNMPGYTEELGRQLMYAEGLTEKEKEEYPTKCPSCHGAPDGTRYCPFCGTKLV